LAQTTSSLQYKQLNQLMIPYSIQNRNGIIYYQKTVNLSKLIKYEKVRIF